MMKRYELKIEQGRVVRVRSDISTPDRNKNTRFPPIDEILSRLSERQGELEAA